MSHHHYQPSLLPHLSHTSQQQQHADSSSSLGRSSSSHQVTQMLLDSQAFHFAHAHQPQQRHQPSPYELWTTREAPGAATVSSTRPATSSGPSIVTNVAQQSLQCQNENLRKYALAPKQPTNSVNSRPSTSSSQVRPSTSQSSQSARQRRPISRPATEEKTASPPSAAPYQSLTARRPPPSTLHHQHARLAGVDLSWTPANARLPPCLSPRVLVEGALVTAEAELGWVHSGVFATREKERTLVQQLKQQHTKPVPETLSALANAPTATAFPPPQLLVPQSQPQQLQPSDLDPDADEHQRHDQLVTTTHFSNLNLQPRHPLPPPIFRSNSSVLNEIDHSYEQQWAIIEAQEIEAEQQRIMAEYEHQKMLARRKKKHNKINRTLRSQSPDIEDADHLQSSQQVTTAEEKTNEQFAQQSTASLSQAASTSSPTPPVTAAKVPVAQSQFAAFDSAIDAGIDITTLPLAFQLPASNQATAASQFGKKASTTAASASASTKPMSKLDVLEASIAAQVMAQTSDSSPKNSTITTTASPSDARRKLDSEIEQNLLTDTNDLITTNEAGVDVEEAAALAAFDASKASAQGILDRYEAYQRKVNEREMVKLADKQAAMNGYLLPPPAATPSFDRPVSSLSITKPRASPPPTSPSPLPSDEAQPVFARAPSPAKYLRVPGSASAFFDDSYDQPDAEPTDETVQDDINDQDRPLSPVGSSTTFTSHTSHTAQLGTVFAPGQRFRQSATGVGIVNSRDNQLKMVSLRTTGWGSQIARAAENKKGGSAGAAPPKMKRTKSTPTSHDQQPRSPSRIEPEIEEVQDASDPSHPQQRPLSSSSSKPTTPFARPASTLSQRSWSNRIKRHGVGETAGRGSDMRPLPPSAAPQTTSTPQSPPPTATTLAREEADLLSAAEAMRGTLGLPSPSSARSHPLATDDLGRTMLPDPTMSGQATRMLGTGSAVDEDDDGSVTKKKKLGIDIQHALKQIDRSVARATGRDERVEVAEEPDETIGEEGGALVPSTSSSQDSSSSSSIFPNWLWKRPDFQTTYRAVPFDTCLRILHMFPDERTELHLSKLREWILNRALQQNNAAVLANEKQLLHHSATAHGSLGSTTGVTFASGSVVTSKSPSRITSRAPSRSPSRSPSRATLHHSHRSHASNASTASNPPPTTQTVNLPPSTLDYLSSLPRPILDGVLRVLKTTNYSAGEVIWQQGKQGDLFGILVSGKIQSRRIESIPSNTNLPPNKPALVHAATQPISPTGSHASLALPRRPNQPGGGGNSTSNSPRLSSRQSRTTAPPPTLSLTRAMSGPNSTGGSGSLPTASSAASAPQQIEYVQLILPGSAFGHDKLVSDIEATNHAQVQRKRTLRLWHLLRLSVRKALRDDEGVYNQLSRVTYSSTSGDPSGTRGSMKTQHLANVVSTSGGGGTSHSSGGGLSEMKVRKETLIALTDVTVFTISFYAFASIEFEYQQMKLTEGIRFLGAIPFFKTLVFSRLRHLYSLLLPRTLVKNEIVWRQGSNADEIVFIEYGALNLTREVIVTESHRHPVNVTQWICEESTHILACKPFAVVEARDYVGEDLLDSTVRDYTVRCRSDTAKVWFLRKRYIHLLSKYRHLLEDITRVRRSAAAAAVTQTLIEKYPGAHAQQPFTNVDWTTARDGGAAAASSLHYRSGSLTPLDLSGGTKEFLFLEAGAIYVRFDPSYALLKMVAQAHELEAQANAALGLADGKRGGGTAATTTAKSFSSSMSGGGGALANVVNAAVNATTTSSGANISPRLLTMQSRRGSATTLSAAAATSSSVSNATVRSSFFTPIPLRPRKIYRLYTAPNLKDGEPPPPIEACFSLVGETAFDSTGGDNPDELNGPSSSRSRTRSKSPIKKGGQSHGQSHLLARSLISRHRFGLPPRAHFHEVVTTVQQTQLQQRQLASASTTR